MPVPYHHTTRNHLLAALPAEEFSIAPHREPVTLAVGDFLYEPGQLRRLLSATASCRCIT